MEFQPRSYTITFTHHPSKWDADFSETAIESQLASGDFKEANEVIAKIKKALND